MRKTAFYPKLAAQNIRRNKQFYLPFILTCVATAAMFYIMCFLTFNPATIKIHQTLYVILNLGCIVVGLFSAIFLFYTNSFLMKRRQKEIGLYNILGMGKGNIASILFFEILFVTLITLICGIALGIILSKLVLLILCRLVAFPVPFGFEVSLQGIAYSIYLFCGIFFLILLSNLIRIKLSNPIELLRGGDVGEKEPKTKWILALVGILTLGAGYWIAIVTDEPLQAIMLFFVAVILVIIGTYLLFTASSIAILKRLKSKPKYYYSTKHFIPVSGMIYRMKQNAVGLGNICILATMVLVMVSGTICMYLGTEDSLNSSNPTDVIVQVYRFPVAERSELSSEINNTVSESGLEMSNITDLYSISFSVKLENGSFSSSPDSNYNEDDNSEINILPISEYNRLTEKSAELSSTEALVYEEQGQLSSFSISGKSYNITGTLEGFPSISKTNSIIQNRFFIVLSDAAFDEIVVNNDNITPEIYYGFDLSGTDEQKTACYSEVRQTVSSFVEAKNNSDSAENIYYNTNSKQLNKQDIFAMSGGFLFLGLFLGVVFLMATVLIIYYKQLSEGYDDKGRFEIMQKVGLSRPEIKKAIRSQVLIVFFLPLGMAVIHIAFAFKMITKLLLVFNLTNTSLFAICTLGTVAVFAIIYGIVYMLTAKVYYKIVS